MRTVVHIIEKLCDFGGTPRKLLYLASHKGIAENKLHFVTYVPSTLSDKFEALGATVHKFDTMSIPSLIARTVRLCTEIQPDVICTHFSRPLLTGFVASRITGIPFIHNEHSSAAQRLGMGRHAARFCLPYASAIICNSAYTALSISHAFGIKSEKLNVVHNPVQERKALVTRTAMRARLNIGDHEILVGHVGGLIPCRDQATLVRSFATLYKSGIKCRLVIIGEGPMRHYLVPMVDLLGISPVTEFVGYTDEIGDYLQAMDIYVNPTLDEGFGIAVVEAMLAELPVVLADAGAHGELVKHNADGMLYRGGDESSLATALIELASSSQKRMALGKAARQTALERFHPKRYATGYDEVIAKVLRSEPLTGGQGI